MTFEIRGETVCGVRVRYPSSDPSYVVLVLDDGSTIRGPSGKRVGESSWDSDSWVVRGAGIKGLQLISTDDMILEVADDLERVDLTRDTWHSLRVEAREHSGTWKLRLITWPVISAQPEQSPVAALLLGLTSLGVVGQVTAGLVTELWTPDSSVELKRGVILNRVGTIIGEARCDLQLSRHRSYQFLLSTDHVGNWRMEVWDKRL